MTNTTQWRGSPIVPDVYEVGSLVPLARKARRSLVDFDWSLTPDDLKKLRRAVYEWGSRSVRRYRCFDARLLKAIGLASDDLSLTLQEPGSAGSLDCQVTCTIEGGAFRLSGHAPLDIILGYARGAIDKKWRRYLGATAADTLSNSINNLGWDVQRLSADDFRPVWNALYGLPLGYGVPEAERPPVADPVEVPVRFHGPYGALENADCPCLFTADVALKTGVYLWTIRVNGVERPWYVGQTRRGFGQRMAEHITCYLSGQYKLSDARALAAGENRLIPGLVEDEWPRTLPLLLGDYQQRVPHIMALISLLRFHVAPLDVSSALLNRVEGAIGRYYQDRDDELRDFFFPGIKLPAEIPYDTPLRLLITSQSAIAGLPPVIPVE